MKKYGNATQLWKQPEGELDYEQDGLIRGHLTYEGDVAKLSSAPAIGDVHPSEPKAFIYARKVVYLKLSKVRVHCDYIGIAWDPTEFIIEGTANLSLEPISTHKNFVAQIGGTAAAPLNKARFDEDGLFIGFPPNADNNLGGVETYNEPRGDVRRTYWTRRLPDLRAMGTILAKPGDVALPTNVVNCLWGFSSYRQVGPEAVRLYQVTEEIKGSGRKGWNTLIYA